MDRRSWLWRRKSSEKSPGETESSGSVSSHSERFSDDQETLRASSNNASPNHAQSPEVSSNTSCEVNETVRNLTEKLSAALLNIRAKEDLVKQHAKVAEEAVSGWEKAETEVTALKQQLDAATQKNTALEDRISHLDGALKECVRQLRQSREEQEEKIHDALVKNTREWESEKFELQTQLVEIQAQLEVTKAKVLAPVDHDLRSKLDALEKKNSTLKIELLTQSEELQVRTLERDLSIQAAETASKQHLVSIKKLTKLEAECRRLRAAACKTSLTNDHKIIPSSVYVESLIDSQSDSGERLLGVENEQSCSDSWASALIAELDQFKNEKACTRNLTTSAVEIDLMDDFLEMERLAALPEADCGSSSFELDAGSDRTQTRDGTSKAELEIVQRRVAELEEVVEKMANEKADIEMSLVQAQNDLHNSSNQLIIAENKLMELQRQLDLVNGAKHAIETEAEPVQGSREPLESQLESSNMEVGKLQEKVSLLERKVEDERVLSPKFAAKCGELEAVDGKQKALESQLEAAHMEVARLGEKVVFLQAKVDEGKVLSAELSAKCQDLEAVESKKKILESQLKLALVEVGELREKVGLLEEVKEKKTLSAELSSNLEASEAEKKIVESQLELANTEVWKLHEKVEFLERKVKEESVLCAELVGKAETLETNKKVLESQLESAHVEVGKLLEKVGSLERKIEEEMALSAELAVNIEALEAKKKVYEYQLKSSSLEVGKLCEKVALLEMKTQEERELSSKLAADAEAFGAEKMRLESLLESANLEVGKLCDKVALLEMQVLEQRMLSAELAANAETSNTKKMTLNSQLESANSEVRTLRDKVGLLERKVDDEMVLSAEFAAKCRNLENEVSRKKPEVDFRQNPALNGEPKMRQEKALAAAAGKLAECQKTITSLSRQLKSLRDMEDFMIETEELERYGGSPDVRAGDVNIFLSPDPPGNMGCSALANGNEKGFSPTSSSTLLLPDHTKL